MSRPVTVYWDIENCSVPAQMKGYTVVAAIRKYCTNIGVLKNISAVGNLTGINEKLRSELQQSGVLLIDVPTGKPSAADMALMVELLKLACDHPPPHQIVLISGDRDFSNVLNVLVFRGYSVTLIHKADASEVLKSAANESVEWKLFLQCGGDVKNIPHHMEQQQHMHQHQLTQLPQLLVPPLLQQPHHPSPPVQNKQQSQSNVQPTPKPTPPSPNTQQPPAISLQSTSAPFVPKPPAKASGSGNSTVNNNNNTSNSNNNNSNNNSNAGSNNNSNAANSATEKEVCTFIEKYINSQGGKATLSFIGGALRDSGIGSSKDYQTLMNSVGNLSKLLKRNKQFYLQKAPSGSEYEVSVLAQADTSSIPANDYSRLVSLLEQSLRSLKKDYFLPTEKAVHGRLKQMLSNKKSVLTDVMWNHARAIIQADNKFVTKEINSQKCVYLANDIFEGGCDPSNPEEIDFPDELYNELKTFLVSVHPKQLKGRYGFAMFLKEKGPASVKALPLGKVTVLVQKAILKKLLKSSDKLISTNDVTESSNTIISTPSPTPEVMKRDWKADPFARRIALEVVLFICLGDNPGNASTSNGSAPGSAPVANNNNSTNIRSQIGSISSFLNKLALLNITKQFYGGLRKFLDETKFFTSESDGLGGLFISVRSKLKEHDLVSVMENLPPTSPQFLLLGNLPFHFDNQKFVEFLQETGVNCVASVVRNSKGKSKGFGLVQVKNDESSLKKLRLLNDKEVEGKKLHATWSTTSKAPIRRMSVEGNGGGFSLSLLDGPNLIDFSFEDDIETDGKSFGVPSNLDTFNDLPSFSSLRIPSAHLNDPSSAGHVFSNINADNTAKDKQSIPKHSFNSNNILNTFHSFAVVNGGVKHEEEDEDEDGEEQIIYQIPSSFLSISDDSVNVSDL